MLFFLPFSFFWGGCVVGCSGGCGGGCGCGGGGHQELVGPGAGTAAEEFGQGKGD